MDHCWASRTWVQFRQFVNIQILYPKNAKDYVWRVSATGGNLMEKTSRPQSRQLGAKVGSPWRFVSDNAVMDKCWPRKFFSMEFLQISYKIPVDLRFSGRLCILLYVWMCWIFFRGISCNFDWSPGDFPSTASGWGLRRNWRRSWPNQGQKRGGFNGAAGSQKSSEGLPYHQR